MECPKCGRKGCPGCGGAGTFKISSCPKKQISSTMLEVLNLAERVKHGVLPLAGGSLDQCRAFMETADFVINEVDDWKDEERASAGG